MPDPVDRSRVHLSRTPLIGPPIYQTTIFRLGDNSYDDVVETGGLNEDRCGHFHNPTVAAAEVARLERVGIRSRPRGDQRRPLAVHR